MVDMETTRIFVRNLPPTVTEEDFRNHFEKRYAVTDVKLLSHRRIGYVGFKTAQDAKAAVRYFNKSFMRMSKIGVELADASKPRPKTTHPTSRGSSLITAQQTSGGTLKRKLQSSDSPVDVQSTKYAKLDAESQASQPGDQDRQRKPEAFQSAVEEQSLSEHAKEAGSKSDALATQADNDDDSTRGPNTEAVSDQDWIRSRTSRLLGLLDEDEEKDYIANDLGDNTTASHSQPAEADEAATVTDAQQPTPPPDDEKITDPLCKPEDTIDAAEADTKAILSSSRLFLRNLPYTAKEDDLVTLLEPFGTILEIHLPLNLQTGDSKGFAFAQFSEPEKAVEAFRTLDGSVFQGRLLHIIPAAVKRDETLDEFAIAQLPLKKQRQLRKKAEASSSTFRWNSMYMNADAVMSSISERLGVAKSELLDPSSSDAAVKQAQAETHVIQETKAYFEANGVDLKAFESRERSDTTILVKNFAYGTREEEIRDMFAQHGDVSKILMPPSGTIAIVDFKQAPQARTAFAALAYRKFKDSVLFLEKAPKTLFNAEANIRKTVDNTAKPAPSTIDLVTTHDEDPSSTSTLFVRNLNFATTNDRFRDTFAPLEGLVSARVKTKADPKRPGQTLSMGFGFLEFRNPTQAKAALSAMDGFVLDDHRLLIRASHKGHDAAEERRAADQDRKNKIKKSKLIIKNLPFEVSKKDIRTLFKSYGQLRAVRVPKKFDNSRKGYAFAEFTTAREAESAMEALRDSHLLGRRLVIEYATGEAEDPEDAIAKMQQKVGKQSNSVALQKLTAGSERRKFVAEGDEMEAD